MKKLPKRIAYMDIARGLAVVAVIVGHAGSPFRSYLYLFHIPLFFIIAGFFYKDTYTSRPFLFIKKRIKSLYVPFLLWQIAFLLLHNPFYHLYIYNVKFGSHTQLYSLADYLARLQRILTFNVTEDLVGIFWFFTVLFEISALFVLVSYLLHKVVKKDYEVYRFAFICGMCLLGAYFSMSAFKLPNKFDVVFTVSIFFYLGYLYKKFEHHIPYRGLYFILGTLLLFVTSFFAEVELVQNVYPNILLLLLTSIIGSYCTFYLAKRLERFQRFKRMFTYIGRNSIPILALHVLAFKAVHLIQIAIYNHPIEYLAAFPIINGSHGWWLAYTLAGVLLPLVALQVFNKGKDIFLHSRRPQFTKNSI